MSQTYYIDGYNVIHHSRELSRLLHGHFEVARDKLIDQTIRWCAGSAETAKIIFDGQGKRTEGSINHPGTQYVSVLFSSKHKTADMIIERAVFQAPRRGSIIVVSADRGITDLCMGKGALVMHPTHFLTMIREADSETKRSIAKTQTKLMGTLEDSLDNSARELLERIRKNLDS
jgi:predicted RNA-binding protein with PIN domain